MKKEYWDVTDAQVVEKTGHPLGHWMRVLAAFDAATKPSNAVVEHLQSAARSASVLGAHPHDEVPQGRAVDQTSGLAMSG